MWNPKIFGLLLLGSCGVLFFCSKPVASEETTVENDAAVTLSTELMPPPLPAAGHHHGIVYLVNLYAVRNKTVDNSDGKAENALIEDSPEILGPLASLLLVVDDADDVDDDQVTFDDLAKIMLEDDYGMVSPKEQLDEFKINRRISEESNVAEYKPIEPKKSRTKRTLKKGYNNYPSEGGGQPSGETTVENDAAVTLSTEVMPPVLPAGAQYDGIVDLINLHTVGVATVDNSDGKAENAWINNRPKNFVPEHSMLQFDLAKLRLKDGHYGTVSPEEQIDEVKINQMIPEKSNVAEYKPIEPKKSRTKRTLKKCNVCGGGGGGGGGNYGGGYGGGYNNYPSGGGGQPSGGGQTVGVIPILIVPVSGGGGGGGGRRGYGGGHQGGQGGYGGYGGNGGNGYHPNNNNGGGGNYYPNTGGHPNGGGGGGYYPVGGGGGGGSHSQASAQASAQASSSSW